MLSSEGAASGAQTRGRVKAEKETKSTIERGTQEAQTLATKWTSLGIGEKLEDGGHQEQPVGR